MRTSVYRIVCNKRSPSNEGPIPKWLPLSNILPMLGYSRTFRIHTTKTLPIDFLYKITTHLTPFSRLLSNWSSQVWYHLEDWDHTSSTNMKKQYDEGYFFEILSLAEMHALNAYLAILKCFLKLAMHAFPKSLINSIKNGTEKIFAN